MKPGPLTTSVAILALMAGGAMAQTTATDGATAEPPVAAEPAAPAFTSIEEMTVGDVVGMLAYDPDGNKIAEIDYVIDQGSGAAAVLGIGGFLGMGEYTVALPLADFQLSADGTFFTLPTDKESLKAQPEVDESTLEGLPDDTPIAQVMGAGAAPATTEAPENDTPADGAGEEPEDPMQDDGTETAQ